MLPQLVRLAREMDVPIVATNDVHYLRQEDAEAQEALMCIQTGKTLEDTNRMRMTDARALPQNAAGDGGALFPQWPEALERTVEIAERCNVEFDFKTTPPARLPAAGRRSPRPSFCAANASAASPSATPDDDGTRAEAASTTSLSTIESMGLCRLLPHRVGFYQIRKGHTASWSGPGAAAARARSSPIRLGITAIDPLKYNLLFERFLNPERVSMPDLDIDFCYERRQEVIDYVRPPLRRGSRGADHHLRHDGGQGRRARRGARAGHTPTPRWIPSRR